MSDDFLWAFLGAYDAVNQFKSKTNCIKTHESNNRIRAIHRADAKSA